MADTLEAVLEFLRKNNFSKAEAALLLELSFRSSEVAPALDLSGSGLVCSGESKPADSASFLNSRLTSRPSAGDLAPLTITEPVVPLTPVASREPLPLPEPSSSGPPIREKDNVEDGIPPLVILPPTEPALPRLPSIKVRSVEKRLDSLANGEGYSVTDPEERLPPHLAVSASQEDLDDAAVGSLEFPLDPVAQHTKTSDAANFAPSGRRSKRPSISLGIIEDEPENFVELAGSHQPEQPDVMDRPPFDRETYPEEFWDSDTYDDEDDPGYVRQPIEDEEAFIMKELNYANERDAHRAASGGIKLGPGGLKGLSPQEEEEAYFSGEEYYLRGEDGVMERGEKSSGLSQGVPVEGRGIRFPVLNSRASDDPGLLEGASLVDKRSKGGSGIGDDGEVNDLETLVRERSSNLALHALAGDDDGDRVSGGEQVLLPGRSEFLHGTRDEVGGDDEFDVSVVDENGLDTASVGFIEAGDVEETRELMNEYYKEAWGQGSNVSKDPADLDGQGQEGIARDRGKDGFLEVDDGPVESSSDGGGLFGQGGGFSFPVEPAVVDLAPMASLDTVGGSRSVWSVADANSDKAGEDARASPSGPDETLASWRQNSTNSSPLISSSREDLVITEEESYDLGNSRPGTEFSGLSGVGIISPQSPGREEAMEREEEVEDEETAEEAAVQEQIQRMKAEEEEYEVFELKIIHRKNRTGFEEDKDFPVVMNSVIAGRYHVTEYLGSAAFSKAIQAHDLHTGMDVCMKIIKNNKDFLDQSLDEIKLLKYINKHDPADKHHILRLYDYFYHKEHLFIVCELLRANLYEFHKYNRESGGEVYFTMPRLQSITRQCLEALQFLHSLGLIHCDLKPENILVKSYSRCEIKVIDLGSSCFQTDHLCSYVQSRSYRAPEVILGLPYGQKIDIWSLGCILAELCSGNVLFQNDSLATLLARVVGILGPISPAMLRRGRDSHKYFTRSHMLYERNPETDHLEYLVPKRTMLRHRLPMGDSGFTEFVAFLLQVDPDRRPDATEALQHPWLSYEYEPTSS